MAGRPQAPGRSLGGAAAVARSWQAYSHLNRPVQQRTFTVGRMSVIQPLCPNGLAKLKKSCTLVGRAVVAGARVRLFRTLGAEGPPSVLLFSRQRVVVAFEEEPHGGWGGSGMVVHKAVSAHMDVERIVHAPAHITQKVVQLFRSKSEFTFLASIQQKSSTSGVIFSIHESEHSYFELESSGLCEEIRYRYSYRGKPRSESFPYRLADGQWHKIALSISASHLLLHVDCNRIYERVIDPPQMDLTPGSGVWLGQHSHKHGLFK
ncbi:hypothetical protein Z043_109664, partial [Scleropages formosus]